MICAFFQLPLATAPNPGSSNVVMAGRFATAAAEVIGLTTWFVLN